MPEGFMNIWVFLFDGTEKLIKIGRELIEVRYYKSFG